MKRKLAIGRHPSNFKALPVLLGGVLLALLAFACGPAEEPTATPEPERTATAEAEVAEPTATAEPEMAEPTPTTAPKEKAAAGGRPKITAETIERLRDMSVQELAKVFPAAYPANWEPEDIKDGGSFRAAITWDISMWDVRKTAAGGTTSTTGTVYEKLVQYRVGSDVDNAVNPAIVPDLAKSWEFNEDGTRLTFNLHEGMCWGDIEDPFQCGPEIVAEDFIYILTEYRDNSVQGGAYKTLEAVEAPSKYTVVLHFNGPSFFMLPFFAGKDAQMFNPYLAKADQMKTELVGPGPFILVEDAKSQYVRLKRNPNHFLKDQWGNPLPYLAEVEFIITPEEPTRIALMRTGKVEYAASIASIARDLQPLLETNPNLQVHAFPAIDTSPLVSFQLNNPVFQDVNVRRALALATDTRGMSNAIFDGDGMPLSKVEWNYWKDTQPTWDTVDEDFGAYMHHYDVERAKQLWAKTGLGEVTLNLPYYEYKVQYRQLAELLVDDWRKLGVTLKAQNQDYSDYNSSLQQATHQEMIFSWQQQAYDPVGAVLTRLHSEGPGNRENISDPEIDRLADELVREADPVQRQTILQKILDIAHDQVYYIPTTDSAVGFRNIVQPYVRGVRGTNYAFLSYYYQGPVLRQTWLDK